MNSEWQRYEYIQKLLNKIKDLEEKNVRLNNDIGVTMVEMIRDVEIDGQPLDPHTHREYTALPWQKEVMTNIFKIHFLT